MNINSINLINFRQNTKVNYRNKSDDNPIATKNLPLQNGSVPEMAGRSQVNFGSKPKIDDDIIFYPLGNGNYRTVEKDPEGRPLRLVYHIDGKVDECNYIYNEDGSSLVKHEGDKLTEYIGRNSNFTTSFKTVMHTPNIKTSLYDDWGNIFCKYKANVLNGIETATYYDKNGKKVATSKMSGVKYTDDYSELEEIFSNPARIRNRFVEAEAEKKNFKSLDSNISIGSIDSVNKFFDVKDGVFVTVPTHIVSVSYLKDVERHFRSYLNDDLVHKIDSIKDFIIDRVWNEEIGMFEDSKFNKTTGRLEIRSYKKGGNTYLKQYFRSDGETLQQEIYFGDNGEKLKRKYSKENIMYEEYFEAPSQQIVIIKHFDEFGLCDETYADDKRKYVNRMSYDTGGNLVSEEFVNYSNCSKGQRTFYKNGQPRKEKMFFYKKDSIVERFFTQEGRMISEYHSKISDKH